MSASECAVVVAHVLAEDLPACPSSYPTATHGEPEGGVGLHVIERILASWVLGSTQRHLGGRVTGGRLRVQTDLPSSLFFATAGADVGTSQADEPTTR